MLSGFVDQCDEQSESCNDQPEVQSRAETATSAASDELAQRIQRYLVEEANGDPIKTVEYFRSQGVTIQLQTAPPGASFPPIKRSSEETSVSNENSKQFKSAVEEAIDQGRYFTQQITITKSQIFFLQSLITVLRPHHRLRKMFGCASVAITK